MRSTNRPEILFPFPAPSHPPSLRVAIDLSTMRPGGANGGVKPFVLEYVRELSAIRGSRLTWVFLTWSCSHAEVRQLAKPGDELICVRDLEQPVPVMSWRAGETVACPAPLDLLLQLKVDVLYSPLGCMEFACPGVPLIVTIVDLLHRDYPATLPPHEIEIRERTLQAMVRSASRFQCISDYTAGRMLALFPVLPEQIFRTYIVIQHRLELSTEAGAATKPARPYFLYPANAWAHKNHLTLLVAYRMYRHEAGDNAWDLVLTGHDDDAMRRVVETASSLGLSDCVRFLGHLPPSEFAATWAKAGALVFPSLHEGFGIPLLEAMHFRLPILASSAGSLPEVAGDAALAVDCHHPGELAAGLRRIAEDAGLREQLIAAGQRRQADFSLRQEAEVFLRTIDETAHLTEMPLWAKGLHPDGWIETLAVFGLPALPGRSEIEIVIGPCPAPRRLRTYLGLVPWGGFDVPAAQSIVLRLPAAHLDGRPLVLEVPDAVNLNPGDHRQHGILIRNLRWRDEQGTVHPLNYTHP